MTRTWVLTTSLLVASPVSGQTTVTLCQTDVQAGTPAGVNLARALQTGGRIRFACPAGTTVRITREHFINGATEIDGENRITLDAQSTTNMFRAVSGGQVFTLRNIILRRGTAVPGRPAMIWGVMETLLDHVEISSSTQPIMIQFRKITALNSTFYGNTGPVLNAPNLEVRSVRFVGTIGSAMRADGGRIVLDNVQVAGNRAPTDHGSEFANCSLEVSNSQFLDHWTTASVGGGLRSGCQKTLIVDTTFTNNRAVDGGAFFIGSQATDVELRSVTFTANQATRQGGAIALENTGIQRTIRIHHGTFRGNHADRGGAMSLGDRHLSFNENIVEGTANSFRNNSATSMGGAIYGFNAGLKLTRAIFVDNVAANDGAAIMLELSGAPRPFVLANAIVARHTGGGAAIDTGSGGRILNATVADNQTVGLSSSRQLELTNTVLSNNRNGNCLFSAGGSAVDRGSNVEFPRPTCASTIPVRSPVLDAFYVPGASSPLQRNGSNAVCLQQPVDGRDVYGQRRPRTDRCTIGAVEGDIEQLLARTRRTDRRVKGK